MTTEERVHHGARVARFLLGLVAMFSLFGVVLLAVLTIGPAVVLRWESVVVAGDSMSPRINRGDVVVIEPFDDHRLASGAVVVFRDRGRNDLVTHRIARVNDDGTYLTRGDANEGPDSTPLTPDRIEGVGQMLVPRAGMVTMWWQARSWEPLVAFGGFLLCSAWAARFAMQDRFDPWGTPETASPPSRRAGAHALATPVVLVALTAMTLSSWIPPTSDAAFTSTTDNRDSTFEASGR